MENCDSSNFLNAYNKLQKGFELPINLPLIAEALAFFYTIKDNELSEPVQKIMNVAPSPLLYAIKAMDTDSVLLAGDKAQEFQLFKMFCGSVPFFFSNKWSSEWVTPLLYACSCKNELIDVVNLLLMSDKGLNMDSLLQEKKNAGYQAALRSATAFKHQSIVNLLKNFDQDNDSSDDVVIRGSFFSTPSKKKCEKERKNFMDTIKFSNYLQFKKILQKKWITVNDECYFQEALNQYFFQRELFKNILAQNEHASQALKDRGFLESEEAKNILFDIIEQQTNLDIAYVHPTTHELLREETIVSTPLKEAIRRNDRSLILQLAKYRADLKFVGFGENAVLPLELAKRSSQQDLYDFIVTLYTSNNDSITASDESLISLDPQNETLTIFFDNQYDNQEKEDSE
jgi:hypothetical protein